VLLDLSKPRTSMAESLARAEHKDDGRAHPRALDTEWATGGKAAARRPASALLTASEASAILGIGRSSLYQLILRGELPVLCIRRSVRGAPAELEAWIRERSTKANLERKESSHSIRGREDHEAASALARASVAAPGYLGIDVSEERSGAEVVAQPVASY
jgi:excisionase family DNA binding protein